MKKVAAEDAELAEVGRQRPVERVERRVVGDEAGAPEDEGADGHQPERPRGQLEAPQRFLHEERHEEEEGPEDDRVRRPEDADERVGGHDGEELVRFDEGDGLDLVDPHDHPLDDGEAVVDEPDDDEPQGQLLHGGQCLRLEQALFPVDQCLHDAHDLPLTSRRRLRWRLRGSSGRPWAPSTRSSGWCRARAWRTAR